MVYKPYFKLIIYLLLVPCLLFTSSIHAEPSPNRVIIIGTKHNGNKKLTVKSMYNVIKRINPDLILMELDSTIISNCSINKVWGAQTAEWLGIWKNPVEYRAVRKFQKQNKLVCVSPFDVYIPNRKTYIAYNRAMEKSHQEALSNVYLQGLLNGPESAEYEKYTEINNAFLQVLDSSLLQMNRASLTDTIENILYREKHFIRRLTLQYPALQPYGNWYNAQLDFWDERSAVINKKIWDQLNANSNKTIVIVTGLLHKADIENFLQKKELAALCKLITLESALSNPPVPDF
ncbi:hypothetical protein [Sediminibacterium sp. TEGAF015]|uniref:hypothetical protein n=1 Tax=Sediminibacterium sp. TEGAF015 TaxID=575378 RepID=UPI00220C0AA2|nr:hypothetical protein [Sediminibacterium sp. TEGAF015]BDQ10958.1 hypothetical protein TEGAF0_01750 [Sediminibacterium sp. TEGAF015]